MQDPREEFEALLAPHVDALFGFALHMTYDREDAKDLLQEALYYAYRGLDSFERGSHFKAWVFRIMSNAFISRKRQERRRPEVLGMDLTEEAADAAVAELEDAETDWEAVFDRHLDDDVKRALEELPAKFRAPLLLNSLGELSYKEVGRSLGLPVGTVMSRIYRARQRLRRALRGYAHERGILSDEGRVF